MVVSPSPFQILKRVLAMLFVGGILLYLFYEPKEGNFVNDLLKQFGVKILSNLAGVE